MAMGPFSANIGNAGTSFARLAPTEEDTSGIANTATNLMASVPSIQKGTTATTDFIAGQSLLAEGKKIVQGVQDGMEADANVQVAGKTLAELRSATEQGQVSSQYAVMKAQAALASAKGLSPVYSEELETMFAGAGIDPNGRNAGIGKQTQDQKYMQHQIDTVMKWSETPDMVNYLVYKDGLPETQDNIDVMKTIDNVSQVNRAKAAVDEGEVTAASETVAMLNNQTAKVLSTLSTQITNLQTSGGDAAANLAAQNQVVANFKNQILQNIAYGTQQLSKFAPGSDAYKNVSSALDQAKSYYNDLKTQDPQSLTRMKTTADMYSAMNTTTQAKHDIAFTQNFGNIADLTKLYPLATGAPDLNNQLLQGIADKKAAGETLTPEENSVYNNIIAPGPNGSMSYYVSNAQKANIADADEAAKPGVLSWTWNSVKGAVNSVGGYVDKLTKEFNGETQKVSEAQKQVQTNAGKFFDFAANSGQYKWNLSNYNEVLAESSKPGFTEFFKGMPKPQQQALARNATNVALSALEGTATPYGVQSLAKQGYRFVLDSRTDSVTIEAPKRNLSAADTGGNAAAFQAQAWNYANDDRTAQQAQTLYNKSMATLENMKKYDPNYKTMTKTEIFASVLQEQGIGEDHIIKK